MKSKKRVEIRLKNVMESRGITQRQLSELSGVRQAAISQLSRGNVQRIDIGHIQRIASALDITDINELIAIIDVVDG